MKQEPKCDWCGHPQNVVWVHGHGQCAWCGVNTAPCCSGAPCPVPATNS